MIDKLGEGSELEGCFYEKGLRFECQGCRYCCSVEPGYVFLSEEDIKRLADGLKMDKDSFIKIYCRLVDMGSFKMISLQEKDNYDCIFLTKTGCSVYKYRPLQCQTYPFWAHVVEDQNSWEQEAKSCPGIGKGKLYSKKEIEVKLASRVGNEPAIVM